MKSGFINYIKTTQPMMWQSIENAAQEGLIYIDEEMDAITATNRLLLTYPQLHEVLNMLTENWLSEQGHDYGRVLLNQLLNSDNHG